MNFKSLLIAAVLIWIAYSIQQPSPTPIVDGVAARALIVHETRDDTPEQGQLFRELRLGDRAKWIKDRDITLQVLDDDSIEADGSPAIVLKRFAPYQLPELLILDATAMKCLNRQKLPATSDEVLKALGKR